MWKSPWSLPAEHYGGARKRVFLGLLTASCFVLCAFLALFLIVPWLMLGENLFWLKILSISTGTILIFIFLWLSIFLVISIAIGANIPGIRHIRHLIIRLFFPIMEILAKLVGIEREKVRQSFIKVNNELILASNIHTKAEKLLVLLPHCIQRSKCPHRLSYNMNLCQHCGKCNIGQLLEMQANLKFKMAIATGGTIARRIVQENKPKLIIAVACERDLTSGIQDSYPIPVFAILNSRPCGPCRDTLVPMQHLEAVVQMFISPLATNQKLPELNRIENV